MPSNSNAPGRHDLAALLWGERAAPTRGPKRSLTVDRIAGVAVAIADSEGLDAVAMQRVADRLDVTKMSLYRYVAGKSELVAVMIEDAVGDPPDLTEIRGWRARLEHWTQLMSAAWDAHPWLPWATVGERPIGPREARWSEAAVACLGDTPLTPTQAMDVVSSVSGLLRSTQSGLVAGTHPWHDESYGALLRRDAGQFDTLSQVTEARRPRQARDFGLQCLLDGVQMFIETQAVAGPDDATDPTSSPDTRRA